MKILDITQEELIALYQQYISEPEFVSIFDNVTSLTENQYDVSSGADYLYDDFLFWLQKKEEFNDDEVSIFVNIHGDIIYEKLTEELNK